jgi:hypothetical protein
MVLLRVGLTLIGVWLSVLAIPQFISQLVALANANPALELGTTGLIMTYGSRMVSAAVQLVFGILLIVTARRVSARLWLGRNSRTESGSALPTCASCGTAYNPDDYEPGSDARCVQCREPLDLGGA